VQNRNQEISNSSLIPLWVQPGIIGRDHTRQGVTSVSYAGQTSNGNLAGTIDMWHDLVRPLGLYFSHLPSGSCYDLSRTDLLLAIRSFDARPYNNKPPSKLVNAWHAKIPFIGGHDSAYKQVGTPGHDYLIAASPTEVIATLQALQTNEHLYRKLVLNGLKQTVRFTDETISNKWEEILTGPVLKRYFKWKENVVSENYKFKILLQINILKNRTKQYLKRIVRA
jgi:hypothetical protein